MLAKDSVESNAAWEEALAANNHNRKGTHATKTRALKLTGCFSSAAAVGTVVGADEIRGGTS